MRIGTRGRARRIALAATVLMIVLIATVVGVPGLRLRVQLVLLHAAGRIPDVDSTELLAFMKPDSTVSLVQLAKSRNPYAVVENSRTTAADVEAALREGAGELLESIRLFDVYTGDQVGEQHRSLAYRMVFRAPDRTLTTEEVNALRDRAIASAAAATGAVQRGALAALQRRDVVADAVPPGLLDQLRPVDAWPPAPPPTRRCSCLGAPGCRRRSTPVRAARRSCSSSRPRGARCRRSRRPSRR